MTQTDTGSGQPDSYNPANDPDAGSEMQTRTNGPYLARVLYVLAVLFALYHIYASGFGTPAEHVHMGWHLAGITLFVLCAFPLLKTQSTMEARPNTRARFGNVPLLDWVLIVLGMTSALFLTASWRGIEFGGFDLPTQAMRQGDPATIDLVFGLALIVIVLELARRSLGIALPLIICIFIAFGVFGPYMPIQILQHPGIDLRLFVNNIYFPSEGIFGVTLWIISTVVFNFILFGVVAQRMGLGQFFIDNAMVVAGRYTGGPAKVSVVSSAFFGTISGSSIANTVSTGSLTIPNMKRMGYPGHFAGGVEAAASSGGQITPPIMGAAAFLMAEFLEIPYTSIVIAAIVPAAMHYIGVLSIVHLTAKRLKLPTYPQEKLPQFKQVWANGWHTALPLFGLITVLFSGYTPNMSAFVGMCLCIIVGFTGPSRPLTLVVPGAFLAFVWLRALDGAFDIPLSIFLTALTVLPMLKKHERETFTAFFDSLNAGVRYALAVSAAGAAVGIVIGIINTTGVAFRLGFLVTQGASDLGGTIHGLFDLIGLGWLLTTEALQTFLSLLFIAILCILMGAGLPTTALYIMLVSVAQPALALLGIPAIATHFFVLYYGVISEITPPVCAAAYAAAGIAGSNPFRTGITAFTLGIGKLLVPMVFVYAPVILIVLPEYWNLAEFLQVSLTCALGVYCLSVAIAAYNTKPIPGWMRWIAGIAGIMLVSPGTPSDLIAAGMIALFVLSERMLLKEELA